MARPFTRVSVVGMGTMGTRIALEAAIAGYDVVAYDISPDARAAFELNALATAYEWEMRGAVTSAAVSDALTAITIVDDPEKAANTDLLIEAASERMPVKHAVFEQFDRLCPPHTVLVSNTSTLLPRDIETALERKGLFAALHFNIIRTVVEIMRGSATDDQTVTRLQEFVRTLGERPLVMIKEKSGYVVNSMVVPWLEAGLWLAVGGYAEIEEVDRTWMLVTGAPAGPFGQMDYIGLDVAADIGEIMQQRGVPGHWQEIRDYCQPLIGRGHLGIKTGQGFYSYPDAAWLQPDFLRPDGA